MVAQTSELSSNARAHLTELRRRGGPDAVVRLSPTLTLVCGFGRPSEVSCWLYESAAQPAELVGADAFDDWEPESDQRLAALDAQLDVLEQRAEALEARINELDASGDDGGSTQAEAMMLALEWDDWLRSAPARPVLAIDPVVSAHLEVEAARTALAAAQRSDRRELAARFDAARGAEAVALAAAGVASYGEYLINAANLPHDGSADSVEVTSADWAAHEEREVELRARCAQLLGRFPGPDPAAELRGLAMAEGPDRDELIAELEAIDREGEALADERAAVVRGDATPVNTGLFERGEGLLVVDGYLLDAVPSAVRDELLRELVAAAAHRQLVLVSDDISLERWALSVPAGIIWTLADSHQLTRPATVVNDGPAWDPNTEARQVAERLGVEAKGELHSCVRHPGTVTRVVCRECKRPFCDLCLMKLARSGKVVCLDCAMTRAGLRRRRGA